MRMYSNLRQQGIKGTQQMTEKQTQTKMHLKQAVQLLTLIKQSSLENPNILRK